MKAKDPTLRFCTYQLSSNFQEKVLNNSVKKTFSYKTPNSFLRCNILLFKKSLFVFFRYTAAAESWFGMMIIKSVQTMQGEKIISLKFGH